MARAGNRGGRYILVRKYELRKHPWRTQARDAGQGRAERGTGTGPGLEGRDEEEGGGGGGRSPAVFRATISLKRFHLYSALLRFDDRETRAERHAGGDKLAAARTLWNLRVARLPLLYNPGRQMTVDEQLVRFRGRCPFRQYMPSKLARYGIKFWVACDAKSSYAWNVQVYTGKPCGDGGGRAREKNLSAHVVLDLTWGLPRGSNVKCDNFFTSYSLAARLLQERGVTLVGTLRANRTEVPRGLLDTARRAVRSSAFAFTPEATVVSYLAKRNRNMLLLSTAHAEPDVDPGCVDGKRKSM